MARHTPRIGFAGRARSALGNGKRRARAWWSDALLVPLFEPVLHPTYRRIRTLGLAALVGHPLFHWVLTDLVPQPYESLPARAALSASGLFMLLMPGRAGLPPSRAELALCSFVFWVNLPVFFTWMYLCNGGNPVWLAFTGAMLLIYYAITDWRLATLGAVTGSVLAFTAFRVAGPELPPLPPREARAAVAVLGFCWGMALLLGVSRSNLRREQLNQALATMGIMAHELRTPLATLQLIGDALRREAIAPEEGHADKLAKLAERLGLLVRNMNHQIDLQVGNARLLRLPQHGDTIDAAELVQQALADYPYRNARERASAVLRVYGDFQFRGSRLLFAQVLTNLLKNALRSLAAASGAAQPGDLLIEVGAQGGRGRIAITDRGVGMDRALQQRLFQPFFSTNRGTGQGLGLAFCQRVVQSARGTLRVSSAPLQGAVFTIELPATYSKMGPASAPAP